MYLYMNKNYLLHHFPVVMRCWCQAVGSTVTWAGLKPARNHKLILAHT